MKLNEGIVVKSIKYQDNSKIITLVNSNGLSSYYVRGGASYKSKNFSYSNVLTKIAYDFVQKNNDTLKILTTGNILDAYSNIKQSFNKLNDCFLILELINQLGEHINDFQTLYLFLDDILKILNTRDYSQYYLLIFKLKLLYLLGVGPEFNRCTNCGTKSNLVGFVFDHGGMQCQNCRSEINVFISKDLLNILKFLYLTKLEDMSIEVIQKLPEINIQIIEFIDNYYEHFLGFKSRASQVIKKMNQ